MMMTTPGVEGMPAWAYACGACVRANEDDRRSQRLSEKGVQVPAKELGPALTLG
jgi:hypothetical protein